MSGIAGVVRFDGAPVEPGIVEGMTAAMAHRGPDGIRHRFDGPVAFGHCMLRTTPESLEETQPLASEDGGLLLVMDGRVDNWEELRADLLARGARLRTRADAELVLHAYDQWGRDCLGRIDGDFAMVIWDARRRSAFCARDRMGTKPFHYHWDGRCLAFASDINAVVGLPWVPEELNEGMVAEFLAADWHSREETFWRTVCRLPVAHRMEVSGKEPRIERYWMPDPTHRVRYKREEEYVEHYRALFFDSVRRLSRSHRPLGCEVSGGLDSSAVFAVAEHLRRENRLLAPEIDGYTLHFGDGSEADEIDYARALGQHLGREIREIPPASRSLQWFREIAEFSRDFPFVPNGVMGLGIHEAAHARGSRVLLSGSGGDQWLGGSPRYLAEILESPDPRSLIARMRADSRTFGAYPTLRWAARCALAPFLPDRVRKALRTRATTKPWIEISDWLSPPLLVELRNRELDLEAEAGRRYGVAKLRKAGFLEHPLLSHTHAFMDRLASLNALEIRRPYETRQIVEHAFSFPESLFSRGNENKHLHRASVEEIVPASVARRTSKAEFSVTYDLHLVPIRRFLLRRAAPHQSDWVQRDVLTRLLREVPDGLPDAEWRQRIWNLFACELLAARDTSSLVCNGGTRDDRSV